MITKDYSKTHITPEELDDLRVIADVEISNITLDDYPNLLVFPDSFTSYDRDLGKKVVCHNLPVRPGRNLAIVVESAAVNFRQKKMGYNAAQELSNRIQSKIARRREGEEE